jgi:hypothetical protein
MAALKLSLTGDIIIGEGVRNHKFLMSMHARFIVCYLEEMIDERRPIAKYKLYEEIIFL